MPVEKMPPGWVMQYRAPAYGLGELHQHRGKGDNMLRSENVKLRVVQPRALQIGDRLITGDVVKSHPREAGNGGVWIHLFDPDDTHPTGHWIEVAARIPIACYPEGV